MSGLSSYDVWIEFIRWMIVLYMSGLSSNGDWLYHLCLDWVHTMTARTCFSLPYNNRDLKMANMYNGYNKQEGHDYPVMVNG